ncbi:hypothetical protein GLOIN_2v1775922 [Rhizophagus clarus]|uniref:Uncharacterized protein n=1 Tax=Rhizophagus clarus TaxID=94130 RepID=A0A8H3L7B3_9GLOM|nr:hypothetical protein GLOIN_2v1775922 [Rhizophagus clarus]
MAMIPSSCTFKLQLLDVTINKSFKSKSWDEISKDFIQRSFKSCRISTNLDGLEDDYISDYDYLLDSDNEMIENSDDSTDENYEKYAKEIDYKNKWDIEVDQKKDQEKNYDEIDKINIDHNDIFININNLDCWNSSNIGILCLAKEIIPKSFIVQFKYLIWEHRNVYQVKLEQSRDIDSQKKKSKSVGIKDYNKIKSLNNIYNKYKIWIDGYFNMDGH